MILVSHDPHLVELVADRLWLVKDGPVTPFDDDMEAYRRMLLSERAGPPLRVARGAAKPPAARPCPAPRPRRSAPRSRNARRGWRSSRKCARRSTARLANPLLYARGDTEEIETLQRKRAEVQDGLARAETLWLDALERLEAAGAA